MSQPDTTPLPEEAGDGLHEIVGVLSLTVAVRGRFSSRAEFCKAVEQMWFAVDFTQPGYRYSLAAEDSWEDFAIISGGEGTKEYSEEDDE